MKQTHTKAMARKIGMATLASAFALSVLPTAQANISSSAFLPDHHNEQKKCNPCKAKGCDTGHMKAMAGDHKCAAKKMEMKTKCNPCAAKKMAMKHKCNPCAAKGKMKDKMHKCNPCAAKKGC